MISHFIGNGIAYNEILIEKICTKIFIDYKINLNNLNLIQVSDSDLLGINMKYLNHNTLTDVITFNYSSKEQTVDGEIYMSYERAIDNQTTHKSYNEIYRLIIHGCLHLCGKDDITPEMKTKIHQLEDNYLEMFHVKHN